MSEYIGESRQDINKSSDGETATLRHYLNNSVKISKHNKNF